MERKQGIITLGLNIASTKKKLGKLKIPLPGSLFKTIQGPLKLAHLTRKSLGVTGWRLHINFLINEAMKEGIVDVKLM